MLARALAQVQLSLKPVRVSEYPHQSNLVGHDGSHDVVLMVKQAHGPCIKRVVLFFAQHMAYLSR